MKKLIKKITMAVLVGLMFLGSAGTINAKVIQGTKGRTYITLDNIEKRENKMVLEECFNITSYKTIWNKKKNTYTVEFKVNKKMNCKDVKKIVKQVANKLHGTSLEKDLKEYRTYNIKVKAIKGKTHSHTYAIKGHKIK